MSQAKAVPVSEQVLCRYVSYLAESGLKHRTIKSYLSAIRFLHIAEGEADPFKASHLRLQYVLQGIKRVEAEAGAGRRERLPITPRILRSLKGMLDKKATDHDVVMLWAACCLGFFGFLRAGEMTVPGDNGFDASAHLGFGDISVDNPRNPQMVRVRIKQSKTDPFRKGMDIYLGKTGADLCPVGALMRYLTLRGRKEGPLFQFRDGRFLTRQRLVDAVRGALKELGVDESKYCSHSFRIGAATTAAAKGVEDAMIKTLGRWRSLAYLEYVRIPREELGHYSRLLIS